MDDIQFRLLLDFLGYSWPGYRRVKKGVKKRIHKHMQQLGCRDAAAYIGILAQDADRRQECELLMTVSISRFFRDPPLWKMLENQWLPAMITVNPLSMRVWSAGCACGEEVYSFKILWERMRNRFELLPELEVLATDRHPHYIERAQAGMYSRSSLREAAAETAADFFERRKGSRQLMVINDLKCSIRWETRNLLDGPPEWLFKIIFLRNNILTYCRQKDQIQVLHDIIGHLQPEGLLIIGRKETLPLGFETFIQRTELPYVYRRK